MKVACVYHPRLYTGWGKFHFVADAFERIGCEVLRCQTLEEVRGADKTCDLVVYEQRSPALCNDVDLVEFLKDRNAVHVQWYFDLNFFDDSPLEKQEAIAPFLRIARAMDLVFVKERSRLEDYDASGIRAVWLDQGCPSTMPQSRVVEAPACDVVLWGSSRRLLWGQRCDDVQALVESGFTVGWASVTDGRLPDGVKPLPAVQPLELRQVIEQGKVTLVVDARQDIEGYWSDRIWLAAGAGACCVRRASVGSGHLPAFHYSSTGMLVETVRELCGDLQKRTANGAFARERTMTLHTYEQRCREILEHAKAVREQRHQPAHLQAV